MKSERGSITDFLVFCIFMWMFGPLLLELSLDAKYEDEHPVNTNPISQPTPKPKSTATYLGEDTSEVKHDEQVIIEEHQGDCRVRA